MNHSIANKWKKSLTILLICIFVSFVLIGCSPNGLPPPPFHANPFSQFPDQASPVRSPTVLSADDILFSKYTVRDGLSQSTVVCIYQDHQGYLWFCTNEGADRYNGYDFINFSHDPYNQNTLRDNHVIAIVEDNNRHLWFGTQTGLDVLHIETGELEHITLSADEDVVITSLLISHNGDLWVGAHQGVFHVVLEGDLISDVAIRRFLNIEDNQSESGPVGILFQDSQGEIWAGAQNGLGRYDPDRSSFVWELTMSAMAQNLITQSIIEIEPGVLLLGGGYGLLLFDTEEKTTRSLNIEPIISPSAKFQLSVVWSIIQAENGIIWIGSDVGLFLMDPYSKEVEFLSQIQENINKQEIVLSLFQDREGNVWVGTHSQGLLVYQPHRQKFALPKEYIQEVIQQSTVRSIYMDKLGYLWLGMDQELLKINRRKAQIDRYPYQPKIPEYQIDGQVNAIIEDDAGTLWFGTSSGHIYFYSRGDNSFTRMFDGLILTGYSINRFYLDEMGDMWIGTNRGLYWYQADYERIKYYIHNPHNPYSISHNIVFEIQEDEFGNLWIGTWDGLNNFDKISGRFSRLEFNDLEGSTIDESVLSILPDRSGGLWLGSQNGALYYYDVLTGKRTYFQNQEGANHGAIFSIIEDQQGFIWISTQKGLLKFIPNTETFIHYTEQDGLPTNELSPAYYHSSTGELIYGCDDGFFSFYPEEIVYNPFLPPIVLTKITQNGENITIDVPIDYLEELTISWPNNYFEFEFSALSYSKPEENQYAYYLQGIDSEWVYADHDRKGRYANLPGGHYTLHLIGSNSDGIWNTQGKTVSITVVPPLWQQPSFQIFSALCVIVLLVLGYRYRVRSILAHSRELEKLVDERTSDLSRVNKQLLGEISQREKAENLLSQRIAAEAILTERNRLARELHDAVTQTIISANILAEALPHSLDGNPLKGHQQVKEIQQLTRGALAELRSLLFELRPEGLVKTDLKDLLTQLCKGITGRSGIQIDFDADIQGEIPSEVKITLYRISQEALNNAIRHADPSHINVVCRCNQEIIHLVIEDNGKGFDKVMKLENRMGLGIMEERALDIGATLEVRSQPGEGTTIQVEWYFPKNGDSDDGY